MKPVRKRPKLTEKQIFALNCVAHHLVVRREIRLPFCRWGKPVDVLVWWALDTDITDQIKALRLRRLVVYVYPPREPGQFRPRAPTTLALAGAGVAEWRKQQGVTCVS